MPFTYAICPPASTSTTASGNASSRCSMGTAGACCCGDGRRASTRWCALRGGRLAAGLGFGIVVDDISAPIGACLDGPEHRGTIDSTTAPVPALRSERMFIRAYVELNLPIAEVEATLLRTPAEWIPGLAASAEEHGDHLLTEVGFPVSQLHLGKRVEIDLGRPV